MNILIVDDQKEMAIQLKNDFESYFKHYEDMNIEIKTDAFSHIESESVDIAFLDIDLVTANGIHLAQFVKRKFPNVVIIFVSSKEELVFKTFSVDVFQFIRKRKYEKDIQIVFKQLDQYIKNNLNKKSVIVNGRKAVIRPDKVKSILSMGHDVIIFEDKEYTIKSSLLGILEYLDSPYLIQIQRNLAINFNNILDVHRNMITTLDGKEYKIGRTYQEQFHSLYEEFLWR